MVSLQQKVTKRFLIILALSSFYIVAGGALIAPLIVSIANGLNIDRQQAMIAFSALAGALAFCLPFAGIVVDHYNYQKLLIWAFILNGLAGFASGFAFDFYSLLICRLIQGSALSLIMPALFSIIAKEYQQRLRPLIFSGMVSFLALSGILAPLLGGLLATYHWRLSFVLYLPSALVPLLFNHSFASSAQEVRSLVVGELLTKLRKIALKRETIILAAIGFTTFLALYATALFLPILAKDIFNFDDFLASTLLATQALFSAVAALFSEKINNLFARRIRTISFSFLLIGLAALLYPYCQLSWALYPLLALAGCGFGILLTNANILLTTIVEPQRVATVEGIYSSLQCLGIFLAPLYFQPFYKLAAFKGVFLAASLTSIIFAIFLLFLKIRK